MNFFEQQARARRDSRRLVLLFGLAVLGVIVTLDTLLFLALWLGGERMPLSPVAAFAQLAPLLCFVAVILALVIFGASLFKTTMLRSGGATIARALGGEGVPPGSSDLRLRRLRNVVEEMAIASALPVPSIYWLPRETGINAFAAGYSPADAAITVTRGALEKLSRDELQGVIGHEFSHLLNGDMRLNLRLMGLLFGILVIAVAGRQLVRHAGDADDSRGAAAAIAVGIVLMVVGYVGYFFGQLLRAGVSRSREFLADASAVQFTRQSSGLAGALKKLAGIERGGRLDAAAREDVSHMLFGDGVGYQALFATHPPILQRIRALEPGFMPSRLKALAQTWNQPGYTALEEVLPGVAGLAPAAAAAAVPEPTPELRLDPAVVSAQVAMPSDADLARAATLHDAIPAELCAIAREPSQAVPLLCALLIDRDPDGRTPQFAVLDTAAGSPGREAVRALLPPVLQLPAALRLPLAELAFPGLRQLPRTELAAFMRLLGQLIQADGHITLFEYCLGRLLRQQVQDLLRPAAARAAGRGRLQASRASLQILLSVLAEAGHAGDAEAARVAFMAGVRTLLPQEPLRYNPPATWQGALDTALTELDGLMPAGKELLVEALVTVLRHDGRVTVAEAELLRVVCAALHCPLPPTLGTELS